MEFRLYCELKVNDKKSGKLLTVVNGIYYVDEDDIKKVLRAPFGKTESVINEIRDCIGEWLKADLDDGIRNSDVVYDMDITYLDDEFDEDEEDDEE